MCVKGDGADDLTGNDNRAFNSRSNKPRNKGNKKVLKMVVSANFLPKVNQPTTSKTALKTKAMSDAGIPLKRHKNNEIPVDPPVISPQGVRNNSTVKAYNILPKTIAMRFQLCLPLISLPPLLCLS